MTGRGWQPGDVAMVTDVRGRTGLAMRGVVGWDFTPSGSSLNAYSGEKEPIEARPLLVIDPTRLTWDRRTPAAQEFTEWAESLPAGEFATGILIIADALRDLPSTISPKPAEPTGLGAVVEDMNGIRWTRVETGAQAYTRNPWYPSDCEDQPAEWAEINAVHVLSTGVTP